MNLFAKIFASSALLTASSSLPKKLSGVSPSIFGFGISTADFDNELLPRVAECRGEEEKSPPPLLFVDIVGEDKGLAVGELNTPMESRCNKLGGFVIDRGRDSGR